MISWHCEINLEHPTLEEWENGAWRLSGCLHQGPIPLLLQEIEAVLPANPVTRQARKDLGRGLVSSVVPGRITIDSLDPLPNDSIIQGGAP